MGHSMKSRCKLSLWTLDLGAMPGKSVLDHFSTLAALARRLQVKTYLTWHSHMHQMGFNDLHNHRIRRYHCKQYLWWPFPMFLMLFGQRLSWPIEISVSKKPGTGELSANTTRETTAISSPSYSGSESPYEHLVKSELAQLQKVLLQQHTSHGFDSMGQMLWLLQNHIWP